MTLYRSTLFLVTCFTCLGLTPSSQQDVMAQTLKGWEPTRPLPEKTSTTSAVVVAQASPTVPDESVLRVGSQGLRVTELQRSLQRLGHYNGAVDGVYGRSTAQSVSKFQAAAGLPADGIAGKETSDRIESALKEREQTLVTPTPTATPKASPKGSFIGTKLWWIIGLAIISIGIGLAVFLLIKVFGKSHDSDDEEEPEPSTELPLERSTFEPVQMGGNLPKEPKESHSNLRENEHDKNGYHPSAVTVSETPQNSAESNSKSATSDNLSVQETSRLPKIDIVDELIHDLRSLEPAKRRKAIWELAQRGDSRAAQPLVDLMIDSDSQQRSLILEALSQIGTRTLKPMNRALTISLQDENAEVRKNAIRDVTRIYDLVSQVTQMLSHAAQDPDTEVQETVRWAMGQLNRIRLTGTENLPALPQSDHSAEDSD